jgi:hypothetical protein
MSHCGEVSEYTCRSYCGMTGSSKLLRGKICVASWPAWPWGTSKSGMVEDFEELASPNDAPQVVPSWRYMILPPRGPLMMACLGVTNGTHVGLPQLATLAAHRREALLPMVGHAEKITNATMPHDLSKTLKMPHCAEDTLAEWLRRRPAKPMGSPRAGSNPAGVDL